MTVDITPFGMQVDAFTKLILYQYRFCRSFSRIVHLFKPQKAKLRVNLSIINIFKLNFFPVPDLPPSQIHFSDFYLAVYRQDKQ